MMGFRFGKDEGIELQNCPQTEAPWSATISLGNPIFLNNTRKQDVSNFLTGGKFWKNNEFSHFGKTVNYVEDGGITFS